jgi:hypothetical protein
MLGLPVMGAMLLPDRLALFLRHRLPVWCRPVGLCLLGPMGLLRL